MSDSRRRKQRDPPYWLTGPKGGKTSTGKSVPFVRLYADLLQSQVFQSLSPVEKNLYTAMALVAGENRTFEFTESTAKRFGFSGMALRRGVKSLTDAGFISTLENNRTLRKANLYQFEITWKMPKDCAPSG